MTELEDLKETEAGSTPGPWKVYLNIESDVLPPTVVGVCTMLWECHEPTVQAETAMLERVSNNAILIARLRNLAPELIALWETLQRYEDEVDLPDGLAIPLRALNDKAASL